MGNAGRLSCTILLGLCLLLGGGCNKKTPEQQAEELQRQEQIKTAKALKSAESQARRHPDKVEAQLKYAQLSYKNGDYNNAYIAYRRAAELQAGNFDVYYGLARTNQRLLNPAEALDWAAKARKVKPDSADLAELEGRLHLMSGHMDRAIDDLRKATRLRPTWTLAWLNLAMAYATAGRHAEAIKAARQATQVEATSASTHYALATVLIKADQGREAEKSLRRVLELEPEHATAMVELSKLLIKRRANLEEARQLAIRASQLRDDRYEPAVIAAWVLHLKGEHLPAAQELIKVMNAHPQNPDGWRKLATILRAMGRPEEAKVAEETAQRFVTQPAGVPPLQDPEETPLDAP